LAGVGACPGAVAQVSRAARKTLRIICFSSGENGTRGESGAKCRSPELR